MSKALIVGNWKMNPSTLREAKRLVAATQKCAQGLRGISVVAAPPTIFLRDLAKGYRGRYLSFGAQDVSGATSGAYTGQTSVSQLKETGINYCLVGHSERRAAGETNDDTRKKVAVLLEERITPILCVGERERSQSGEHLEFIKQELHAAFRDVEPMRVGKVIVAYEPIWAIGGEKAMNPTQMHEMSIFIRKTLVATHGEAAMQQKILYGGSVNEGNARDMLEGGDVEGLLVGHVSVDPERFKILLGNIAK
jgi:triosephosphate isomerase